MTLAEDKATPKQELTEVSQHDIKTAHLYEDEHAVGLEYPRVTWWKHGGLRKLYLMMPVLFLGSTVNGYDGSLLNGLQTMTTWQDYFGNPSGSKIGVFTAMQNVGGFCAIFFASYAADILGRRGGVLAGLIIIFVGIIIQVVPSVDNGMFIGGRFLVGLGSNLSQGSAPLLIIELAYPQHRGTLTTMYNCLWYVGSIIAAWTVFGTVNYTTNAGWRIPTALQALMPLIQAGLIYCLPESPRWLCSKERYDEAQAVLVKYHANGNSQDRFVQSEFAEIQETLRLEKFYASQSWLLFFKTPGNRKRLALIIMTAFFSQCSGNGLVSYYLHDVLSSVGIKDSYEQSLINGGLQIWCFLVAIICAHLVDILGRRKLFLIAGIGMLLSFSIWTGCSAVYAQNGNPGAAKAVIAMIFVFYFVAGFAWPGLTVAYCSEILPYNIRAKGLAIALAASATSSVLNQYVNPVGLQSLAWKFYFVYIVILVIECLAIYFFYVETKGPTLEEIARLFDGDDANVAGKDVIEKLDEQTKATAGHVEIA